MLANIIFKSDLKWVLQTMTRLCIQKCPRGLEMRLKCAMFIVAECVFFIKPRWAKKKSLINFLRIFLFIDCSMVHLLTPEVKEIFADEAIVIAETTK